MCICTRGQVKNACPDTVPSHFERNTTCSGVYVLMPNRVGRQLFIWKVGDLPFAFVFAQVHLQVRSGSRGVADVVATSDEYVAFFVSEWIVVVGHKVNLQARTCVVECQFAVPEEYSVMARKHTPKAHHAGSEVTQEEVLAMKCPAYHNTQHINMVLSWSSHTQALQHTRAACMSHSARTFLPRHLQEHTWFLLPGFKRRMLFPLDTLAVTRRGSLCAKYGNGRCGDSQSTVRLRG